METGEGERRGRVALRSAFLYGNHALLSPNSTAMQGVHAAGEPHPALGRENRLVEVVLAGW
ncbi:hypothetical protein ACFOEZ_17815 [Tianweitania populi]|uniref:hypothetical protein n=1 Tax=Tianweitania sp. TaxID=2021634 RepID=UPI00289A3112|nr:hypothetical protein [Tianweitania sp.]